jgi:c-di-GMP-binding flagellar brake protein YcgR
VQRSKWEDTPLDEADAPERRRNRRIRAPLYCRPAGMKFFARKRETVDVSLGGVRIFSDDPMKPGQLLKMEFMVEDVPPVTYTAEVVWIEALPEGAPAKFDVGLKFIQLSPEALKFLVGVLGPPED